MPVSQPEVVQPVPSPVGKAGPVPVKRLLTSADSTPLCADYYSPLSDAGPEATAPAFAGLVVIVHGYCEHRGRYQHVAQLLLAKGHHVYVGDLRGHGESGGERGHVARFGDYVEDVAGFVADAQKAFLAECAAHKSQPHAQAADATPILIGHSLGGLVALQYVLRGRTELRAVILSSPFLGLRLAVPMWKRGLALAASLARPTLRLPNELDANTLSHDAAVCQEYMRDPLVTHTATARWFTETLSAQADLKSRAVRIRVPALFLVAGDDRIVDAHATQAVFDRLGSSDKTLCAYPSLYHEIFNETDKQRVFDDLTAWLATR